MGLGPIHLNMNRLNDLATTVNQIFSKTNIKQDRSKTCFKTAGKDWLLDCKVRLD